MKKNHRILLCAIILILAESSSAADTWWAPVIATTPAKIYRESVRKVPEGFKHPPPTSKQILVWLFENSKLEFPKGSACVGTDFTDIGLGDYLAGYLSEMRSKASSNWIEVKWDTRIDSRSRKFWLCSVMVYVVDENERVSFSSGISFLVDDNDYSLVPQSLRCPGSG